MRPQSLAFRLCAPTAMGTLLIWAALPQAAMAQPAPVASVDAAQSQSPPERVGWLSQATGSVSFHGPGADQWGPATVNYPVATGDSLWTEANATASVAISASRIALAGGTELDVGNLDSSTVQATVPQGEIYLHLYRLASGETWSVQTPRGLVTFSGAGRYGIVAGDTQDPTLVTVLDGSAQVTAPGVSLQIAAGQTATITGDQSFQASVGQAQRDAFIDAMIQAERPPPSPSAGPPAVVAEMPGGDDLSAYGAWTSVPEYGQVWYPQVAAGWVPYREGHWVYVEPWGWTWVDDDPWGFAPFHYGRWVDIRGRWAWTPGTVEVAAPPVYAPALVTFVGLGAGVGIGAAIESGRVGWLPLGPHEAYHPWYHASENYIRAVNRRDVTNLTVINRSVTINNYINRGAATVVPAAAMTESRPVRQAAVRVDPRTFAAARPMTGTLPVRPTAATAGITPRQAEQMHLQPAPHGTPAAARVAPGPEIRPMAPHATGAAARPPLVNHAARPAAAPGAHPVPAQAPRAAQPIGTAAPGLRPPAGHEAGPPPISHVQAGQPPRPEAAPAQRPGAAPGSEQRPEQPRTEEHAPPPAHQAVAPTPEHRPGPAAGPAEVHRPAPEARPAPQVHAPAPEPHPAPQVHAPAPAARPAPEVHTPAPAAHPAPPVHAAPPRPPEVHAAPPRPPEVHAAPQPRPPEVHAAPHPPEVHAAPQPRPPEVHAAPPPQARPQPAPHPAPAHPEPEKRPGQP